MIAAGANGGGALAHAQNRRHRTSQHDQPAKADQKHRVGRNARADHNKAQQSNGPAGHAEDDGQDGLPQMSAGILGSGVLALQEALDAGGTKRLAAQSRSTHLTQVVAAALAGAAAAMAAHINPSTIAGCVVSKACRLA